MYESYYGLNEKPFNLLPDPDYLFMSQEHENTYTHLEYAISENKGFVVVTGEIGSGKTTLINYLLQKIQQDFQIGLINNTYIPSDQLLKVVCQEFELNVNGHDKAATREIFHDFLLEQFASNKRVVLFVDEAQNLSATGLEEIRMLSNLEAEKNHLIQIILVGQPELRQKLQSRNLEQFSQRVSVYCHLKALSNGEVSQYIRHRLKSGGAANADIFKDDAIAGITEFSRGIPRLINILCDTALVYGFADSKKVLDKKVIEDVIAARGLGRNFSDEDKIEPRPPASSDASGVREIQAPQVFALEKRVELLENMCMNLEHKVRAFMDKKDERDTVVLSLFNMLKQSMDSRMKTLRNVAKLKQKLAQSCFEPTITEPLSAANPDSPKAGSGTSLRILAAIYFFLFGLLLVDQLVAPLDEIYSFLKTFSASIF